jgi:hypothetical protein
MINKIRYPEKVGFDRMNLLSVSSIIEPLNRLKNINTTKNKAALILIFSFTDIFSFFILRIPQATPACTQGVPPFRKSPRS